MTAVEDFFGTEHLRQKLIPLRALHILGCEVRIDAFGSVQEVVLPPDQPDLISEDPWST